MTLHQQILGLLARPDLTIVHRDELSSEDLLAGKTPQICRIFVAPTTPTADLDQLNLLIGLLAEAVGSSEIQTKSFQQRLDRGITAGEISFTERIATREAVITINLVEPTLYPPEFTVINGRHKDASNTVIELRTEIYFHPSAHSARLAGKEVPRWMVTPPESLVLT